MKALVTFAVLATAAVLAAAPLPASAEGMLTAEGVASAPRPGTVSGRIALSGLSPGGTFQVVNAYQVLPEETNCPSGDCVDRFLPGTYLAAYSACRGGSISGETEVIGGGGAFTVAPGAPPENSGSLTLVLTPGSGSASCDYSVSMTKDSFSAALGAVRRVRLDVWILAGGRVLGRVASPTVQADWHADPAVIPEPPFAALIPVSALLVMGGAFLIPGLRRREAREAVRS